MLGKSFAKAATVVALAVTSVAIWTGSPALGSEPEGRAAALHVLVGVTPSTGFDVAVDGDAIPESPVSSDSLGILEYVIDADALPPGSHTIWFGPPGEPPPPELVISGVTVDSVTQSSALIRWSTNLPADSRVEYGATPAYGSSTDTDPTLVLEHSVVLSGLNAGSTYHFRAVSEDGAGQTALSGDQFFETSEPPPPPLEVANVEVVQVDTTSAIVEWSTNRPATSMVEYGPDEAYGSATDTDPALVLEHSVTLTGLAPGTVYHFRAVSDDGEGDAAASGDEQFETPLPPPPPLEILDVSVDEVGASWAEVSWSTSRPATSMVRYGLTDTLGSATPEDTVRVVEHSVTLTELQDGTLYHFCVCSVDTFGMTADGPDSTFTTLELVVTGPPVITDVWILPDRVNSVVVTWTTDRPATSQVRYGTKGDLDRLSDLNEDPTTQHYVRLKPVVPRHEYAFVVMSACGSDTSDAGPYTFATSLPNTEPATARPVTIGRTRVLYVDETSASLGWATDRPCSTRVEYGADGAFEHSVLASCVADCAYEAVMVDLEPGTIYSYRISAWDDIGDTTVYDGGTFETAASPDNDPPGAWSGSVALSIHPNPSFGDATLSYSAPAGVDVRARIYSPAGRLVRELSDTTRAEGESRMVWDGDDSFGCAVRSGVYLCEFTGGGEVIRRKLTVLR